MAKLESDPPSRADAVAAIAESIRRAESAIADMRLQFVSWVRKDIEQIDRHLAYALTCDCLERRAAAMEDIRRIAHNIKGQAGTFGFADLTKAAAALDALIKNSGQNLDAGPVATSAATLRDTFVRGCA